ncbi:MAG: hypothetical protein FWF92_04700 [Oscillospiraceae bacterium]|nr:hypothetical protein [Oscillospiraceae bacterium]
MGFGLGRRRDGCGCDNDFLVDGYGYDWIIIWIVIILIILLLVQLI